MSSLALLAVKAAKTFIMCYSDQVCVWLSDSQDQKSLTHCWRSFPGWGNEHVSFRFIYKNGLNNHGGKKWLCSLLFVDIVRPKIVDATLTVTFMA